MTDVTPQLLRILRQSGWEYLRPAKGDHQMWWHPATGRKIVVDSKILSRHSANGALKQAGLPKAF